MKTNRTSLEPSWDAEVVVSAEVRRQFEHMASQIEQWHDQQEAVWRKYSHTIAQGIKRFTTALQKSESVGRYGWTIPMIATPREIVEILDSISDEASADTAFVRYFTDHSSENLKQLARHIISNPSLVHWEPAIQEAVFCLNKGKYRACVALLLPMLEGVSAYQFSISNFHKSRVRKKVLEDQRQRCLRRKSIKGYAWLAFIGFVQTVFQFEQFNNPHRPCTTLNRHVLLHGRDIPRGRLEDCIRLLLAIDTVTKLQLTP